MISIAKVRVQNMKNKKSVLLLGIFLVGLIFGVGNYNNSIPIELKIDNNEVNNESGENTPLSALTLHNCQITLNSTHPFNQNGTKTTQSFTVNGNVTKFISGSGWVPTNGIEVHAIIDGVASMNITSLTENIGGVDGRFNLTIPVPIDYDYTQHMQVLANVTDNSSVNIRSNQYTVLDSETPALQNIITDTIMQVSVSNPTGSSAILPDDDITVNFTLTDINGAFIPDIAINNMVTLYRNNNYTDVVQANLEPIGTTGKYAYTITQRMEGWTALGYRLNYIGGNEYGNSSASVPLITVGDCKIDNSTLLVQNMDNSSASYSTQGNLGASTQIVYAGGNVRINGKIELNGSTTNGHLLSGHYFNLYKWGQLVPFLQAPINSNGEIDLTFNLDDYGYDYTYSNTIINITFALQDYDTTLGTAINYTFIVYLELVEEPIVANIPPASNPANWGRLWIIIAIAGLVIGGLIVFQRQRIDLQKKRDESFRVVDKSGTMELLMSLCNVGKWREAIIYTYFIYTKLIYEKFALKKGPSETLKEFSIKCVTRFGQDPLHLYPYVAYIQKVAYGNWVLGNTQFEQALKLFGQIFEDITGNLFSFNIVASSNAAFDNLEIDLNEFDEPGAMVTVGAFMKNRIKDIPDKFKSQIKNIPGKIAAVPEKLKNMPQKIKDMDIKGSKGGLLGIMYGEKRKTNTSPSDLGERMIKLSRTFWFNYILGFLIYPLYLHIKNTINYTFALKNTGINEDSKNLEKAGDNELYALFFNIFSYIMFVSMIFWRNSALTLFIIYAITSGFAYLFKFISIDLFSKWAKEQNSNSNDPDLEKILKNTKLYVIFSVIPIVNFVGMVLTYLNFNKVGKKLMSKYGGVNLPKLKFTELIIKIVTNEL